MIRSRRLYDLAVTLEVIWLFLKALLIVAFHFSLAALVLARDALVIAACGRFLGFW